MYQLRYHSILNKITIYFYILGMVMKHLILSNIDNMGIAFFNLKPNSVSKFSSTVVYM